MEGEGVGTGFVGGDLDVVEGVCEEGDVELFVEGDGLEVCEVAVGEAGGLEVSC